MDEFPPTPVRAKEIEVALAIFATVTRGDALYVSSPLTTGQRAFDWHRVNGARGAITSVEEDFESTVVNSNRVAAAEYVEGLRATHHGCVIDPTALDDVPSWTQSDYRYFWGRVIDDHASAVIFRNGWEHSSGCAYEFLVAARKGIPLFREDMTPLTTEDGLEALRSAVTSGAADRQFVGGVIASVENVQ